MKLYEFFLVEHNGEQEYTHYQLVRAKTENAAHKKAQKYARGFYSTRDVKEIKDSIFEFFGGKITVIFYFLGETTEIYQKEKMFQNALID